MPEPRPSATCQCGYALLPGQRCPECGREYSDAVSEAPVAAQLRLRILQFLCTLGSILAIGVICWPGPHGGPQFLGSVLFYSLGDDVWVPLLLIGIPCLTLVCSCAIVRRTVRITVAGAGVTGLLVLFLLLLRRIYPPALPVVIVSASPFLILLGLSAFMATRPRRQAPSSRGRAVQLTRKIISIVLPRSGASARLVWFRIAFWLQVLILVWALGWPLFTGEPIWLAPPIVWVGVLASPVLVVFMIGIWLVGRRSR